MEQQELSTPAHKKARSDETLEIDLNQSQEFLSPQRLETTTNSSPKSKKKKRKHEEMYEIKKESHEADYGVSKLSKKKKKNPEYLEIESVMTSPKKEPKLEPLNLEEPETDTSLSKSLKKKKKRKLHHGHDWLFCILNLYYQFGSFYNKSSILVYLLVLSVDANE